MNNDIDSMAMPDVFTVADLQICPFCAPGAVKHKKHCKNKEKSPKSKEFQVIFWWRQQNSNL